MRVIILTPYGMATSYPSLRALTFMLNESRMNRLLASVPGGYPADNDNG